MTATHMCPSSARYADPATLMHVTRLAARSHIAYDRIRSHRAPASRPASQPRLLVCLYGHPLQHVHLKIVSIADLGHRKDELEGGHEGFTPSGSCRSRPRLPGGSCGAGTSPATASRRALPCRPPLGGGERRGGQVVSVVDVDPRARAARSRSPVGDELTGPGAGTPGTPSAKLNSRGYDSLHAVEKSLDVPLGRRRAHAEDGQAGR